MKLQHKIAGTILLPLAAAAMSTAAHAALEVHGFAAVEFAMDSSKVKATGAKTTDTTGSAATSRLSIKSTDIGPSNATVLIEGDFWTGSLRPRHAVVFVDGWAVGQTWSPSANLNGLLPTIDFVGFTGGSVPAGRTPQITKVLDLGGSTLKVGVEDAGTAVAAEKGPAIPDLAVGFSTKTDGISIFAGGKLASANSTAAADASKAKTYVELTASAKMDMGGINLVGAFTSTGAKDTTKTEMTAFSVGAGMDLGGGMSLNAMFESNATAVSTDKDQTTMFVNAFYKMPSGLEFGAELQSVSNKGYVDGNEATNLNFQGKFAF